MFAILPLVLAAQHALLDAPLLRAAAPAAADTVAEAPIVAPPEGTGALAVHGAVVLAPEGDGTATLTLRIVRGAPGEAHAFLLYEGACGDDRAAVPLAGEGAIAMVDDEGHAAATEVVRLPAAARVVHVNVLDSGDVHGALAGCATLSLAR